MTVIPFRIPPADAMGVCGCVSAGTDALLLNKDIKNKHKDKGPLHVCHHITRDTLFNAQNQRNTPSF